MIDQILVVAGITFLVMISPGPDMVIVMRNILIGGRSAGLQPSLGVLGGNLVHITYCAVGIGWLISQSILLFTILKYAGAAYLIYLGVVSFFSKGSALETAEPARPGLRGKWFLQGFLNTILNPKGTLFYLGVFTMIIWPETSIAATLVLILVMMAISACFWLVFVLTLDQGVIRGFLTRGQRMVSRVFGGLLVFLGIRAAIMER